MRFMTPEECLIWAEGVGILLDERGLPVRPIPGWHHVDCKIPPAHTRLTWFCRHVERSLQPRRGCLLWVTQTGIWPSSENLHLYDRLRQSYGDNRLLHEAPGHFFQEYESPELVSFLQIAILCGWDAHLLTMTGFASAFVSHDEYVNFASADQAIAEEFARHLSPSPESGPS
jgi:hypothetical protein